MRATSKPILPRPSTPSVLSRSSMPMNRDRSHRPARSERSAAGRLRASASIIAMACSVAAMVLPVGAFNTSTPRWVAASMSMLSTPTPARPTTRRRGAASSTSAVTFVSLRTTSASYCAMRSRNAAGSSPTATSTSPAARRRATPSSAMGSATRMRVEVPVAVRGSAMMLTRRSLAPRRRPFHAPPPAPPPPRAPHGCADPCR